MASPSPQPTGRRADDLVEPSVLLVETWLQRAADIATRDDRATMKRLGDLVVDDHGVEFVSQFIDRVARPDSNKVAAVQLRSLVTSSSLPHFLSSIDKLMLRTGALLAPLVPELVLPLARRRMRSIVGHLVAPADADLLAVHLGRQRERGYGVNVNLLGEAVLGEREAKDRLDRLIMLLGMPEIDYVSVKISAIASQLNHWAYQSSLERVTDRVAVLADAAAAANPPTFVNLDMEEYHDLDLTVEAFQNVFGHRSRTHLDAGIVLQTYLPDVFETLRSLVGWARQRHADGGGTVRVRLVKGANLAMERVDACIHGWEQAPYHTKLETDANYKRCLDWVLTEENLNGVRIGVASHNLFDVAWAKLLADERHVADRVQFEMLQGMAPAQAEAVNESMRSQTLSSVLLYTPAVGDDDFDVAIGYLFRRLEENAAPDNFMRSLFEIEPGSPQFAEQAENFRASVARRHGVACGPARTQSRDFARQPWRLDRSFRNEPDTDPVLRANRQWIATVASATPTDSHTAITDEEDDLDRIVATARAAARQWRTLRSDERRVLLHQVGDELGQRRGELISTMLHEASKTFFEADAEVSEAIDFAHWYAERAVDLDNVYGARFAPFGVVGVIPPWNFPTAIAAGGVLASLAAGNAVVLKPAPETPRCAEIVAEACWAGGVPRDVVQFVRTPDDDIGRRLVESVDAVILTGASTTAALFQSWKPDIRLFAETSGKNALIITPAADLDLAVQDLVRSAFGHAGQKCSAASLAILVGDVYESDRFRRQLVDAVESLTLGPATDVSTDIAPLLGGMNERLERAVATLDGGESWLVEPTVVGDAVGPGVRDGVTVGSWFHRTECFGPVLGLMQARDLDDAITIANSSEFGLTGGLHSLDPGEMETWADRIEVGNGYVNRSVTGAIVQRQPFGGWKKSSVGPGAKAGGPNYLMQLGTWKATSDEDDYSEQWKTHFGVEHDEAGLFCEANVLRYRPLSRIGFRIGADADHGDVGLASRAAEIAGVPVEMSFVETESDRAFIDRMSSLGVDRVRVIGARPTNQMRSHAAREGIHLAGTAVTPAGRVELQNYLREQALSITLHRFGNLIGARGPGRA